MPTGPKQLWVADITYIAIAVGFVYLAAILDAWSRRVVGYAIVRRIDARSTTAGGSNRHSDTGAPIRFEQEHARQMVKFEV